MSTRVKARTRINMSRTAKEGWIPEFTVETEWDGIGEGEEQDEEGLYRIGLILEQLRKIAYTQADKQNRMEGRSSAWKTLDATGMSADDVHSAVDAGFGADGD